MVNSLDKSLRTLREELLEEARQSPGLFHDLAKMEQYVAESYASRALIELLQNAADAGASRFAIKQVGSSLFVANNGRAFNESDVESLCRSGASQKQRGKGTIGYRGIGFKSTVNLARRVFLHSEGVDLFFDRRETQRVTSSDVVPLIRIPHFVSDPTLSEPIQSTLDTLTEQFTTVFLFDRLQTRVAKNEVESFRPDLLLFIESIRDVTIETPEASTSITVKREKHSNQSVTAIETPDGLQRWYVVRASAGPEAIAWKLDRNDEITRAEYAESLIHSFTPTEEFSGGFFKINGDYTTEPSRKNVVLDEYSQEAFAEAIRLAANTIQAAMTGDVSIPSNLFRAFLITAEFPGGRFRKLLLQELRDVLNGLSLTIADKTGSLSQLRVRPPWLAYKDYQELLLASDTLIPLPREITDRHPSLPELLKLFDVPRLSVPEALRLCRDTAPTTAGATSIVAQAVKHYRYSLDELDAIKKAKVFHVGERLIRGTKVSNASELRDDYIDKLYELSDPSDVQLIFKKMGFAIQRRDHTSSNDASKPGTERSTSATSSPRPTPVRNKLRRWRTAEKNAKIIIEDLAAVARVIDVTSKSLGYDLEVITNTGRRAYVEVKTVDAFSDTVKLTNNEYSTASREAEAYYLMLVAQGNKNVDVRIVRNPLQKLPFTKRCVRWEWINDEGVRHWIHLRDAFEKAQ